MLFNCIHTVLFLKFLICLQSWYNGKLRYFNENNCDVTIYTITQAYNRKQIKLMFYICICKSMDYELEEKLYYDRSMCEHTMSICMHNYLLTYAYVASYTVDCTFCSITYKCTQCVQWTSHMYNMLSLATLMCVCVCVCVCARARACVRVLKMCNSWLLNKG